MTFYYLLVLHQRRVLFIFLFSFTVLRLHHFLESTTLNNLAIRNRPVFLILRVFQQLQTADFSVDLRKVRIKLLFLEINLLAVKFEEYLQNISENPDF